MEEIATKGYTCFSPETLQMIAQKYPENFKYNPETKSLFYLTNDLQKGAIDANQSETFGISSKGITQVQSEI